MNLPKEVWANTFNYLSYDEVVRNCRLDKKISNICNKNEFWRSWLNEKFKLDLDENLDYIKLAKKADFMLKEMQNKGIILSLRSFRFALLNMARDDIDEIFGLFEGGIYEMVGIIYSADLDSKYDPDEINKDIVFDLENGINIRPNSPQDWGLQARLTNVGKRNYRKIIKMVMTPTTYISGNGRLKTIEFNEDVAVWARMRASDEEQFSEELLYEMNSLSFNFYLRYFT